MATLTDTPVTGIPAPTRESRSSPVSWAAIFAGALAAAAMSMILLALGAGVGLSVVSPWPGSGASATTFAVGAAVWLVLMQWISAALGGYLAGFLRTRWVGIHTHAVFFRDTVHGFMAWCVSTFLVAALLASSASTLVSGAVRGAASGASQAAQSINDPSGYAVDVLFRGGNAGAPGNPADAKSEAARILARSATNGLSADDKTYLAGLIANRAGISQADAEKRIDQSVQSAKDAAETARKAGMKSSLFVGFTMLLGAFIAAAAGALGGHERDDHDEDDEVTRRV